MLESLIEKLRQEHIKTTKKYTGIILVSVLFAFIPLGFLRVFLIIPIFYAIFKIDKNLADYSREVKKIVSDTILTELFDYHQLLPDGSYDLETLKSLDIINVGTSTKFNDYLEGSIQGVNIIRCDVRSTTRVQAGKSAMTITNFYGQVYEFNFFKSTDSYLKIHSKSLNKGFAKTIKFDDHEFNDRFHAFSDNEHQAFYIMTPHYMERIKALETHLGYPITLVIQDEKLYLSVFSQTDSFEPRSRKQDYLKVVRQDIDVINTIIEELNLK